MTMNNIEQDLAALGETRSQVYEKLHQLGIKGSRFNSCQCPIARYLKSKQHKILGVSSTYISTPYSAGGLDIQTPFIISAFIYDFDAGMYPDLEDKT
jgi:hypothetical protein